MKNKISKYLIAASGLTLALIAGSQLAQADSITQSITDVRQEVQIWTTYTLNPYLRASDLKASVKDGTATLTGTVPEGINKDLAREIALGVEGIKEVDNQIVVDGEKPASNRAPEGGYAEAIDDAGITVAVKSKLLWSKYTSALKTTIETKSGRVTLTGTADSPEAKDLAGRLAANTRGVVSVKNNLAVNTAKMEVSAAKTRGTQAGNDRTSAADSSSVVKASTEQAVTDAWVTTKVKSTLLYSSNVAGSEITVTTSQGVVSLKGTVASGVERALAIELAQNVRGVKSVQAEALTY